MPSKRRTTRVKVEDTAPLYLVDFQDRDEALMHAEQYYKQRLEESERALINLSDGKVNVRHQYGIYRSEIVKELTEVSE